MLFTALYPQHRLRRLLDECRVVLGRVNCWAFGSSRGLPPQRMRRLPIVGGDGRILRFSVAFIQRLSSDAASALTLALL